MAAVQTFSLSTVHFLSFTSFHTFYLPTALFLFSSVMGAVNLSESGEGRLAAAHIPSGAEQPGDSADNQRTEAHHPWRHRNQHLHEDECHLESERLQHAEVRPLAGKGYHDASGWPQTMRRSPGIILYGMPLEKKHGKLKEKKMHLEEIQAFFLYTSSQIYDILMPIIENKGEQFEIRNIAFLTLATWGPGHAWWQQLAVSTWHDPSPQFANFVTTTIYSIADSHTKL